MPPPSYLDTLISLDGPVLEMYARRQGPVDAGSRLDRHRTTVVCAELQATATLVATAASIANRLSGRTGPVSVTLGDLTAFLPTLPSGLEPLRQHIQEIGQETGQEIGQETGREIGQEIGGPADLSIALADFQGRFDLARRISIIMIEAETNGSSVPLDTEMLADAWRRAAKATAAACTALAHIVGSAQFPRTERLESLLAAASRGETPCLDREGRPFIPGWAERRRSERIKVNVWVEVACGAAWCPARLVDISATGLGLRDLDFVRLGDAVSILLPEGRELAGRVMWTGPQGCGVELDTPIAADDPLLAERD